MIYLASPYSSPTKAQRDERFAAARDALAWLLKRHEWAYSPIVHCHELAALHSLPTDHEYWLAYDTEFLRHCDKLYVLAVPGWRESRGVTFERNLAANLGIPVSYLQIIEPGRYFVAPTVFPLDPMVLPHA
jgi:hypothetical protein